MRWVYTMDYIRMVDRSVLFYGHIRSVCMRSKCIDIIEIIGLSLWMCVCEQYGFMCTSRASQCTEMETMYGWWQMQNLISNP